MPSSRGSCVNSHFHPSCSICAAHREKPAATSLELLEWQITSLTARWGNGWEWFYWLYCLRYRLAKPFHNLVQSVQKKKFRWSASLRALKGCP